MTTTQIIVLIIIGLLSGLLAGLFGVGGAIIVIPALVFILGLTQHQAQGTSLAFMLPPVGILATWNYWKSGNVNWKFTRQTLPTPSSPGHRLPQPLGTL